jgi:hypothetical protein
MKRILALLTVALVMAVMMVAMAAPAFALAGSNASCKGVIFSFPEVGSLNAHAKDHALKEDAQPGVGDILGTGPIGGSCGAGPT